MTEAEQELCRAVGALIGEAILDGVEGKRAVALALESVTGVALHLYGRRADVLLCEAYLVRKAH